MQKKSILLVVNALYAGAGKIIQFVADACAKAGWTVTVATLYDSDISQYHKEGVAFVDFAIPTESKAWRFQALRMIRDSVKSIRPDVICAFVSDVVFMTRLATLGVRSYFISAERGDPFILPPKWVKPVKWAFKKSDYSVFQLKGAQDYYDESVRKNSTIIPNPYKTDGTVETYYGTRKKTVVSVGRFVEQKGFDVLIRAFQSFSVGHPDYKLILYGDGPLQEDLIELSHQLGLSGSVEFPGFIHHVTDTIREDGIFVLASRFEGIPNTLIEAMSVGIPTVSTDCSPGGPRFLTDNGRRGILVPVDDVEAISNAMSMLADDPEKAAGLSRSGLEIVEELNPQWIAEKWIAVFEKAYQAQARIPGEA